jgi:hypothetical protein
VIAGGEATEAEEEGGGNMGAFVIFVVGVSLYVAVRVVEGFFGRW